MISLNFSSANVWPLLRIHKLVSCSMAQIIGLKKGWAISLGSRCCWCLRVLLGGRRPWVCSLAKFVMISNNRKGIWNLIQRSHFGCAIQPGVCQINIWCGGHFWGVFGNILPVWWDCNGFYIRHGGNIFVKDYVILWTHSPSGRIPHKCHAVRVEQIVSQVHSNARLRLPFGWACASSTL